VHRVSGIDAAFLYGETTAWHMHVSAVVIMGPSGSSRPLTYQRFVDHVASRIHLAPQFRWRLVETPLGLGNPVFVEDPDFDIDNHIHRIGVPPPGGREQLGNLVGELVGVKLDRTRPLWEFWFVEGLEGGKVALVAKIHHAIVDGVSGSELATIIMDLEPDPPPPPPEGQRQVDVVPEPVELWVQGAMHTVSTPWRMARFGVQSVRQLARFVPFVQRPAATPPIPFQAPPVSFNDELTPNRRMSYTSLSLDEVKAVKDAAGVKLNDVVLAVCAGALRRYLADRGELPESPLIAQVPVSMRADADRDVGTKVSAMFVSLETQVAEPLERLAAIHAGTTGAKEMQAALAAEKIMGISEAAPPVMIDLAARMYTLAGLDRSIRPMNLIISNVPGPPFPIYCAGATIEALYPMGPLLYGTGLNITVFSYRDRVDVGFMVCRELVPEPWALVDALEASFAELRAAALPAPGKAASRKKAAHRKKAAPRKKAASRKKAAPRKG
jgi:WS/DGAT/MGAT family acyltransferase